MGKYRQVKTFALLGFAFPAAMFFALPATAQDTDQAAPSLILPPGRPLPPPPSAEATPLPDDMVDFSADHLTYDDNNDIVTATGDVRLRRQGNRLRADKVTWNRKSGEVRAEGNSIPVAGMPDTWREALRTGFDASEPDRLCALAILIDLDHQRRGLSRVMLQHMRGLAHERGWELVAPVRPSLKDRYPLTPIERYVEWRRDDGLLFDPWLRAHEALDPARHGAARTQTAPCESRVRRGLDDTPPPPRAVTACPDQDRRGRPTPRLRQPHRPGCAGCREPS